MPKEQVPVQCVKCNKPVMVAFAKPTIINGIACSVMIFEHPEQVVCQCGFTVMPQLIGAQLQIVAAPVPEEEKQSVIVPPGNVRL